MDITALLDQAERLALEHIAALTVKTIGQVVNGYQDALTNFVYDAFNYRMSVIDFRRAMKALIREVAPEALTEGWREGGLTDVDVEDEDQEWFDEGVADWIQDQSQYVNDFAQAAYDAGDDKDARAAILDRVDLWVDALRRLGELGRAYALRSEKAYWALGDRATHTPECEALSRGKPHRVQWFIDRGYAPPLHFGCGCSIRNAKTDEVIMGE